MKTGENDALTEAHIGSLEENNVSKTNQGSCLSRIIDEIACMHYI